MYYDVMDPFVSLASAASVTKKIKLNRDMFGSTRDPIQVAKEIATLDQISKGRFLLVLEAVGTRKRWPITVQLTLKTDLNYSMNACKLCGRSGPNQAKI